MRVYGLIGFPLSHSFSKKFFADKFSQEGITDAVYENFPIENISGLKDLLLTQQGLAGLNVTIPYKEAVIPFLHEYNEVVRETGACNCIEIVNGVLFGYNTDAVGFRRSLETKLKPSHNRALILGKGGAAKAVAYVLRSLNIPYKYIVRRKEALLPGDDGPGLLYEELNDNIIADHPLIINTTPLGTSPNTEVCPPIPYAAITDGHYLFDLIYNPGKTLFLQKGESQGAEIQNGLPMLVIQAEESWDIWNTIP